MKRVIVFLGVGPLAVTAWLDIGLPNGPGAGLAMALVAVASIFTLAVSIPVALLDQYLVRALPVFPRAIVTAAAGAIIAGVSANALISHVVGVAFWSPLATFFGLSGAAYAGSCSLLANDWAGCRQ